MLKIKLNRLDRMFFSQKKDEHIQATNLRNAKEINQHAILTGWSCALAGKYSLIHSIKSDRGLSSKSMNTKSPFFTVEVNALLSRWDIISTSLVNYSECKNHVDKDSGRGCFHINLELEVPVQNIVGIHNYDVGFPNHIGRLERSPLGKIIDSYALVNRLKSKIYKGAPPTIT